MRLNGFYGLAALVLCLTLVGCGSDTHESLAAESVEMMEEFSEVLGEIESEADVEAARSKLAAIGEKREDLQARMEALGAPSPELEAELEEKYRERLNELAREMPRHMIRLQQTLPPQTIIELFEEFAPATGGPTMEFGPNDFNGPPSGFDPPAGF